MIISAQTRVNFILTGLISILFFFSCRKETQPGNPQVDNAVNSEMITKVNAWLDTMKTKLTGDRPQKIQSLKEYLNFNKLRLEELFDGEKLIVVPVKKGFQTVNNKEKKTVNSLLLILDKTGDIIRGNIVQYIPIANNQLDEMPVNFFNEYYNQGVTGLGGTLTFLSVADDLLSESKYEGGSLISSSVVETKTKGSAPGKSVPVTNLQCYDVWWVTYYPDGTTTWEYLYSFCEGGEQPCRGAINTNGRMYRVGCGGGGGEREEIEIARHKEWDVYQAPPNNIWQIKADEYIKGKRYAGSNGGGYFTSIYHNSSTCNGQGIIWGENSNTVNVNSQTASSSVSGVYFEYGLPNSISSSASWGFPEIFP